jgi:uncharacterized Zn-binding protein involved in type VI secretion
MPFAARVTDPTSHPGILTGPGVPTVLICGLPAAVVGTMHSCAMPPTAGPHPPSAVVAGSGSVSIGGRAAARVGDGVGCGAIITSGAATVIVGG